MITKFVLLYLHIAENDKTKNVPSQSKVDSKKKKKKNLLFKLSEDIKTNK